MPCHCHATYNQLFELKFHSNQKYYFSTAEGAAVARHAKKISVEQNPWAGHSGLDLKLCLVKIVNESCPVSWHCCSNWSIVPSRLKGFGSISGYIYIQVAPIICKFHNKIIIQVHDNEGFRTQNSPLPAPGFEPITFFQGITFGRLSRVNKNKSLSTIPRAFKSKRVGVQLIILRPWATRTTWVVLFAWPTP